MDELLTATGLPSKPATTSANTYACSVFRRIIYEGRISHGAFRLWHYLRDRKDKNGQTWPKQSTIAGDLHCKESSLTRWTEELKAAGYVSVERIGQNHYYRYTILLGDDLPFVPPKWASRKEPRTPQTGDAKQIACPPDGNVAPPKEDSPRPHHWGGVSNTHQVNSTSKGITTPCYEKSQGWQLRKDLRETNDPAEREAIQAELKRRKSKFKHTQPSPMQSQTNQSIPSKPKPARVTFEQQQVSWKKAKLDLLPNLRPESTESKSPSSTLSNDSTGLCAQPSPSSKGF